LRLILKESDMEVIFLLILISLAVAAGFLLAYLWAMRSGQYDDDYTPAVRILFDDEPAKSPLPDTEEGKGQESDGTTRAVAMR